MGFFDSSRGYRFFDSSVPKMIKAMESIGHELKRYNDAKEQEKTIKIYVLSCTYDEHAGSVETHTSIHESYEAAEVQNEHMMKDVWGYDPETNDGRDYYNYDITPIVIEPAKYQAAPMPVK